MTIREDGYLDNANILELQRAVNARPSMLAFTLNEANAIPIVNDTLSVVLTGNPVGGTFELSAPFAGFPFPWNATLADAQTILDGTTGPQLTVIGGPLPDTPLVFEWVGPGVKGSEQAGTITVLENSLTGGTSPNVSLTRPTLGHAVTWTLFQPGLNDIVVEVRLYTTAAWDSQFTVQAGYYTGVVLRSTEFVNVGGNSLDFDDDVTVTMPTGTDRFPRPIWPDAALPLSLVMDASDDDPIGGETVALVELWHPIETEVL